MYVKYRHSHPTYTQLIKKNDIWNLLLQISFPWDLFSFVNIVSLQKIFSSEFFNVRVLNPRFCSVVDVICLWFLIDIIFVNSPCLASLKTDFNISNIFALITRRVCIAVKVTLLTLLITFRSLKNVGPTKSDVGPTNSVITTIHIASSVASYFYDALFWHWDNRIWRLGNKTWCGANKFWYCAKNLMLGYLILILGQQVLLLGQHILILV